VIHPEREEDGQVRRQLDLAEEDHAGVAHAETNEAAGKRDQQALGDQLPDEPAAACADGEAQRHLARAHRGPAGQQPGDIGARRPLSVRFRASRASSDAAFGSVSSCGDIISGTKKSVRTN